MVIAYVGDEPVGPRDPDANVVLGWLAAKFQEAELRTDTGKVLGRFVPEPFCPWDPTLTAAESERRARESPRMTLDEFWRKMGAR